MKRLIWLALFCLAGICSLFAVRSVVGVGAVGRAPPKAIAADLADLTPPLAKGDRLPSRFFDSALPKTAVETTKIVPIEPPEQSTSLRKQSEVSKEDVVMWHWHEGSKIIRRRRAQ
jgi:hypothetical protein